MPTTTNMGMVLPTEDGSSGTWDTLLNAALTLADSHDHSSGKGVTVKTAGILINADLPFGGYSATGVKALDFTPVATSTVTALAAALFTNSADNELYWRTTAGVNVKLTAGTSLNAALLAGFTGDYGVGASTAIYTSGTSIYNFLKDATTRGYLDTSDIRLFEGTAGVATSVKLKSPAALAGSYTLTFPAALPGSTSLLMLASTGVLSTSLTPSLTTLTTSGLLTANSVVVSTTLGVTGATTLSSTLAVTGNGTVGGTLGVTGAATLSATLGVTGLITATAGLTAAANAHVTLSGTGILKHGTRTICIPGNACSPDVETSDYARQDVGGYSVIATHGVYCRLPLFDVGVRILSIAVLMYHGASGSTRTWDLIANDTDLSGGLSVIARQTGSSMSGAITYTLGANGGAPGLPYTLLDNKIYALVGSAIQAGDIIRSIKITYDQP